MFKTLVKWGLGLVTLLILSFSLLAYWLAHASVRPVVLPGPTGPYAVGRTFFDWTDEARQEVLAPKASRSHAVQEAGPRGWTDLANRELMVWVWYPADAPPDLKPAAYLPGKWGAELQRERGGFLWQSFETIQTHSFPGAPVGAGQPSYPLLIFSTGHGRVPTDYTVLMEDLASHGYVVAGIANTYSAPVVVFPGGRVAKRSAAGSVPEGWSRSDSRAADRLVMIWASDIIFVMDQIESMENDPISPFYGRLDIDRLGVLGHSFGGAAAAEACSIDSRCRASLDLDGSLHGDVMRAGLDQPFMYVRAEGKPSRSQSFVAKLTRLISQSGNTAAEKAISSVYQRSSNGYQVTIQGSGHFSFTDSALLFSPIPRLVGEFGVIEGRRGLEITNSYIRAFFDRYLNNTTSPLIEGASPEFPEVVMQTHAGNPLPTTLRALPDTPPLAKPTSATEPPARR